MTITLQYDDELVLVYDGEIIGEICDGTIYTDSYIIPHGQYQKEDFTAMLGTKLEFNSVSDYTALLKKFKAGCENLSIGLSLDPDSINSVTFNYQDEYDDIDFFQRWGNRITFWKFKDVTKQKIDLFIKD
jgi:hypothetical protein